MSIWWLRSLWKKGMLRSLFEPFLGSLIYLLIFHDMHKLELSRCRVQGIPSSFKGYD